MCRNWKVSDTNHRICSVFRELSLLEKRNFENGRLIRRGYKSFHGKVKVAVILFLGYLQFYPRFYFSRK